ncbi:hypothetical protein HOY80DRAFT_895698, partial [Tuber brumale]
LLFNMERITLQCLGAYTFVIKEKNTPLDSYQGFIDRTLWPIAIPKHEQKSVYNGWKMIPCLKYQTVIALDEIIVYMS